MDVSTVEYIDLSHTIKEGLTTYKGLPPPVICDYFSREEIIDRYGEGAEFHITKIEMVGNTGTYIDCPFHRFDQGRSLSDFPVERFVNLKAVVVSVPYQVTRRVEREVFFNIDLNKKAVLVHTGWSEHWNTEAYYHDHPHLSEGAAIYLRDQGASLVGIDSFNIDDISTRERPVHTVLLGAEIFIVEHLCQLELLPDSGFLFSAVPPKWFKVGSFPVRAFASVEMKSSGAE